MENISFRVQGTKVYIVVASMTTRTRVYTYISFSLVAWPTLLAKISFHNDGSYHLILSSHSK